MTFLPSAIVYVTGYNGIGKTSFLRALAGIQKLNYGDITFGKKNFKLESLQKPYCLYIGHQLAIKNDLTVMEDMKFWARTYDSLMLVEAAINFFSLEKSLNKKCYELSAGNKKKLALSRLLCCPSNLWLLDEIYNNLDQANSELLTSLILAKADSGGIIFLSSHELPKIKTAQILNIEEYLC